MTLEPPLDSDDDESKTQFESPQAGPPSHYTQEPWWVVPLGGVAVAMCVVWKFGKLRQNIPGITLLQAVTVGLGLGSLAAAILIVRSHVRSPFWANVILWTGILFCALVVCFLSLLF